jgi:hypothetical protein
MKILLACFALTIGHMTLMQLNSLENLQVVHLPPHGDTIGVEYEGKLLELVRAPSLVYLPKAPVKPGPRDAPWSIAIKNLGPSMVTVSGQMQFTLHLRVGQIAHVVWNGTSYTLE